MVVAACRTLWDSDAEGGLVVRAEKSMVWMVAVGKSLGKGGMDGMLGGDDGGGVGR